MSQDLIDRYKELLLAENRNHNLMSRATIANDLDNHIADSLAVQNFIDLAGLKIVDIGSGAGFPGLILAINEPASDFFLIESDKKKSAFLKMVVDELGLGNVNIINDRAEIVGREKSYRTSFDLVVCRAVASVSILLEYGAPLLKVGGRMILWKGTSYREDLSKADKALKLLNMQTNTIFAYTLAEERNRVLIEIVKRGVTSDIYPRKNGVPSKHPL